MVTGIESFKEWFKGNESQYAIIGGTACDILMTEEGLDFRATKDMRICRSLLIEWKMKRLMLNSWGLWDERKNRFFRN